MSKLISGVLLLFVFAASAMCEELSLTPTDDMYTDPDHAGTHSATELWVANWSPLSNYQRIMLRFDLSDLEAGTIIDGATLNLNRFYGCPSGDPTNVQIYAITEDWSESSWPGDVHISHDSQVWAIYVFSANGTHCIDISDLVATWVNDDIDNFGLVLQCPANNKFTKCYSKEATNETLRPFLEVNYTVPSSANRGPAQALSYSVCSYPNPFNPTATIRFELPVMSDVSLAVYNVAGQRIETLVEGQMQPGVHVVTFDGSRFSSGSYFYTLMAGEFVETRKMVLIK
ncbi:DNRLRE domain-containing protein [bacterium]|nr:DNRLRE domain-containing protein [bacterium]MBU1636916.1 DNRLRE domain-containing protein [bacterium]MBU1920603.1 DNRLRE domain-containing protein [bacterium]